MADPEIDWTNVFDDQSLQAGIARATEGLDRLRPSEEEIGEEEISHGRNVFDGEIPEQRQRPD